MNIRSIMEIFTETVDSVSVVVGTDVAKSIYNELFKNGIDFIDIYEKSDLDKIWEEDIIMISKNNYKYHCEFFIEPLLNSKGETLFVGSDVTYIDKDLIDAIDTMQIDGVIETI